MELVLSHSKNGWVKETTTVKDIYFWVYVNHVMAATKTKSSNKDFISNSKEHSPQRKSTQLWMNIRFDRLGNFYYDKKVYLVSTRDYCFCNMIRSVYEFLLSVLLMEPPEIKLVYGNVLFGLSIVWRVSAYKPNSQSATIGVINTLFEASTRSHISSIVLWPVHGQLFHVLLCRHAARVFMKSANLIKCIHHTI